MFVVRTKSPVIEPDFKIPTGRMQFPFLLGEVGGLDRLKYAKLKTKVWIKGELDNALETVYLSSLGQSFQWL